MRETTIIWINVVKRAKTGDLNSKELLYNQYSKAMFNICTRMTGNRTDAEDVLQDAFISAFKNLHQLKDENLFAGWLKKIVINECIRHEKRNFNWTSVEDYSHELIEEDNYNWQKISMQAIHAEIKNLPSGCRQIFTLYAIEDYSHKQIADELNITESTSKSQYHRAKNILKQNLSKQIEENG